MDWFLYDNGLRHERVKVAESQLSFLMKNNIINVEKYNSYCVLVCALIQQLKSSKFYLR